VEKTKMFIDKEYIEKLLEKAKSANDEEINVILQ